MLFLHMKNEVRQIYKCHTKIGCHRVLYIYLFFNHSTFPEQLSMTNNKYSSKIK